MSLPKEPYVLCDTQDKIPKSLHWAIIETASGNEPGYDPGDPPSRYNFLRYYAFHEFDDWQANITKRTTDRLTNTYSSTAFVALQVNPVVITPSVAISVVAG